MNEETVRILKVINDMAQSPGWQHLKRDFTLQIEALQEEINKPGGNDIKYSEGDLKKIRMHILKSILDYPQQFTDLITQPEIEDHDPF